MPIKGTYYNETLGSAPTLSTQLGFKREGGFPTLPSVYDASTTIGDGLTINIVQVTIEPGHWLLIATGKPDIPTGTITFNSTYNLRYNITSSSQTFANADAYFEYSNLTFQSSISSLPHYNFSAYVQNVITTTYYVTCSPIYGNGASISGGTNIKIGTANRLLAVRIG